MKYNWALFLIFIGQFSFGQDAHFSQFYASPLTLNPALTGTIDGTFRISANYRDQWRGLLGTPYQTYAVSGDVKFPIGKGILQQDAAAIGLTFFTDRIDEFSYAHNLITLSSAYHKSLGRGKSNMLSAGFQIGIGQRSMGYQNVNFHDQFNGIDGFDLTTFENLPENNLAYGELGVGLHYSTKLTKKFAVFAGTSVYHVFAPQISFYQNVEVINEELDNDNRLLRKIHGHLSTQIKLNDYFSISPRVLSAFQGPHKEINAGSSVRISMFSYAATAVQFGGFIRITNYNESLAPSAVILLAGFEYEGFRVGFSYDINVFQKLENSLNQTAFEISLTYLGEHENVDMFCPRF